MNRTEKGEYGRAYYYISPSHDPYYNISLEDYLYNELRQYDHIYMLWINEPSIFMGRYQSALAETNLDYLKESGIPILRRISGGGTVYHDLGNLNYTSIANDLSGSGHDLKAFPAPIIRAMSTEGVELELSPRGDLRLEGRKVGGSAEATRKGRMLYHMSLLYDANLDELERTLAVPEGIAVRSRVPSVRSKVANLKEVLPRTEHIDAFARLILDEIAHQHTELLPLELPADASEYIARVRMERYTSLEWIHSSVGEVRARSTK